MARKRPIFQLLSSNGDGTGITEAVGDYSSTPMSLRISDTVGWGLIARMIIYVQDSGSFDVDKYGNGIILTNGIRIYVRDVSDQILAELTSFPILTNGDWAGNCYDLTHSDIGQGDEVETIKWEFGKAGQDIIVKFDQGEYFEVYLNDDFSDLVKHKFTVQGHYVSATI